ncbi:MAG: TonB-dependent receptor [Bacteroidota bacterium]
MKFEVLIAMFLFSSMLFPQKGDVKGRVLGEDGKPIANAHILVQGTGIGATSAVDGTFQLNGLNFGEVILRVSTVGFTTGLSKTKITSRLVLIPDVVLKKGGESLDEVVVNGRYQSRYRKESVSPSLRLQTEIVKVPQNIQVISGELLQSQAVQNMLENVTKNVSGAQINEHWGQYASISMRGFRLPAFRNGMNVELPWIGPLSEDMSMVERIEFVKGPSSFILSAGEPGGLYNVVTKKPTSHKIGTMELTSGSNEYFRGAMDFGGKLTSNAKLQYRFNAMGLSTKSHRPFERSERLTVVPSLKYQLDDKTSITSEFTYQKASLPISSAYVYARPEDGLGAFRYNYSSVDAGFPETEIDELSHFVELSHQFSAKWSVHARYMYMRFNQEGSSFWINTVEDNGDVERYVGMWDAYFTNNTGSAVLNGAFSIGPLTHKIMMSYDFRKLRSYEDWDQGGFMDSPENPFNIYDPIYGNAVYPVYDRSQTIRERGEKNKQTADNESFYLQDEIWMFRDKLRLTLAGKYVMAQKFGYGITSEDAKFTPRIGASYDVYPNLTFYGLYDKSFLPQIGASFTGQPYAPEESINFEGGIKKSLLKGRLKMGVTAFHITKENLKVADPDNPRFSVQLGEVRSKGIEFDMQGKIGQRLNVVLNYANTDATITKDTNIENIGNRIGGHAKHITNGWFSYNFSRESSLGGLEVSLGYQYQIKRLSWIWGGGVDPKLPDYFRMDGGISWSNKKSRVSLNVNNILNRYLFSGGAYSSSVYWQSEPKLNGRISVGYLF